MELVWGAQRIKFVPTMVVVVVVVIVVGMEVCWPPVARKKQSFHAITWMCPAGSHVRMRHFSTKTRGNPSGD